MTRRLVVEGLGARIGLEMQEGQYGDAADAALWAQIRHAWSRATVSHDGDDPALRWVRLRLGQSSSDVVTSDAAETLMPRLTQEVTHAVIDARIGQLLLLHAGGVSNPRTGDSLVFVAPGGTGKSTLTRTLAHRYGYLTDETVGVDPGGRIHPYQKPLSTRPAVPGPKLELSPDALGLVRPGATPTLRHLVLLDRRQGVDFQVERLNTIEAIRAMVHETSSLSKLPSALHVIAGLLEATGGAERWTYSEHTTLLGAAESWLGTP